MKTDHPLAACLVALLLILAWTTPGAESWNAGPLLDEFDLTLTPGRRTEVLGPLFYQQEKEGEKTWAIPPLFSHTINTNVNFEEIDFLYPLMTYDRYGDQSRWQFFQLLSFASTPMVHEGIRNRFTLFPVYFQQRSTDPTQNYTALMPFYGHVQKRLFRDEVFFVMLPFYVQSRKKDVITDNYLYPFFHLRHGDGLHGWQFFPLIGREHKEVTILTNGFKDLQLVGAHDKFFLLWPLYTNDKTALGTENPMWEHAVLPFYSAQRSVQRDSTFVLWPFFARIDDREKQYREWLAPWPVVSIARGEGKQTTRVLPFFSLSRNPSVESDSLLWPLFKYDRAHGDVLDRQRRRVLFFLYSDILEKNLKTGESNRRTDLLPFFSRRRDLNGNTRLQVIAPLEVFTIGSHKIERDYSPVWSLWRTEQNPKTGAASQSLLWNLYRRETAPNHKKFSLLFGLFQYQSDSERKQTRLFYIPLGNSRAGANAETPSTQPAQHK